MGHMLIIHANYSMNVAADGVVCCPFLLGCPGHLLAVTWAVVFAVSPTGENHTS